MHEFPYYKAFHPCIHRVGAYSMLCTWFTSAKATADDVEQAPQNSCVQQSRRVSHFPTFEVKTHGKEHIGERLH